MKFGEYVKSRRIAAGMTLRSYCREAGFDPSNWSKIERGIIPPPQEPETLKRVADLLRLGEDARVELADLAAVARGEIPADLKDEELLTKMPAFFRAIKGQEYTLEDFDKLLDGVRKLHEP